MVQNAKKNVSSFWIADKDYLKVRIYQFLGMVWWSKKKVGTYQFPGMVWWSKRLAGLYRSSPNQQLQKITLMNHLKKIFFNFSKIKLGNN